MDYGQKLLIKQQSEKDAQELLDLLKVTPVIDQPDVSMNFVLALSKNLRTEKRMQKERDKESYQKMYLLMDEKLSKFEQSKS